MMYQIDLFPEKYSVTFKRWCTYRYSRKRNRRETIWHILYYIKDCEHDRLYGPYPTRDIAEKQKDVMNGD